MIVADTNLIASLWVPNNMEENALKVFRKDPNWISPTLWRSEFNSVLTLYLRRHILTFNDIAQIMEEAERMMQGNEFTIPSLQVIKLVQQSSCSAYDCEFVALAQEFNIILVTFDTKIIKEFGKIAIHPTKFVN
ncbi:MAG: type II toxin-antitoxin system VapC family toxin [Bacteroidales bacterium]|nr:type II toxin-antitoxin system VapC family toxin [Bacteroidales bacterium]